MITPEQIKISINPREETISIQIEEGPILIVTPEEARAIVQLLLRSARAISDE